MAIDLTRLLTELRHERDVLVDAIAALERLAGTKRRAGRPRGAAKDSKDEVPFGLKSATGPEDAGQRRK